MENISGYSRLLTRTRVKQETRKPLFGKPYLTYGQCYVLWGYFFQLGGILGAKHSAKLDAFGHAFLGARGPNGAVEKFFTEVASSLLKKSPSALTTFSDYVGSEFIGRVGYSGNGQDYFLEHGMEKVTPDTAAELSWQYSEQGAALGAIHPQTFRKMFEQSHKAAPKDKWQKARAAGLDIPEEQDIMNYDETVEGENVAFMEYCRECCPELHSILKE